jgi:REP element-mobilizing transposase RayT
MILLKWLDDQRKEDLMSDLYQSLSHSKWGCKYHVVFVPKRRRQGDFRPNASVGFELAQVRQYIREQENADGTSGQF